MVVLSPETYRSEFARRFLLDQFDLKAYQHNQFARGPYPVNQPYMTQADWVTQNGMILSLNMRGGYVIEANINNNLAKVPGLKDLFPLIFIELFINLMDLLSKLPPRLSRMPNFI